MQACTWCRSILLAGLVTTGMTARAQPPAPAPAAPAQKGAAPAPAAPQKATPDVPGAVELRDPATLDKLCRDVRIPANEPTRGGDDVIRRRLAGASAAEARRTALERIYLVRIPSDRFQFEDYAPAEGRLTLDTSRGFHLMRGTLTLWSASAEPLVADLPVGVAQEAAVAKDKGKLNLTLYVHLDADPDVEDEQDTLKGEPCSTRPSSGAYQLAVTYLGGELVDAQSGRRYGRFITEKGRQTPAVAQALLGDTNLRIGAPDGAGDAAGTVLSAMEARRGSLQECYTRHGQGAEGGVVLALDVEKGGGIKDANVMVASLDNEPLQKCLMAEARGASISAATLGPARVTVPLVWSRDNAE
ncbi:MAG: hypothetical protein AB2A00_20185 [Myxococcota bacterium]